MDFARYDGRFLTKLLRRRCFLNIDTKNQYLAVEDVTIRIEILVEIATKEEESIYEVIKLTKQTVLRITITIGRETQDTSQQQSNSIL